MKSFANVARTITCLCLLTDGDRVMIGELYLPIERLVAYYGADGRGLHLPFNFHLILTAWDARRVAGLVEAYEAALPAQASRTLVRRRCSPGRRRSC